MITSFSPSLSSRRSSSTRIVSPRENVSIIALPSEHPPPLRTHYSLPGEVWTIARPRASYSRELQPYEILGSLGRSKSQQLVSNSHNICSIRDEAEGYVTKSATRQQLIDQFCPCL